MIAHLFKLLQLLPAFRKLLTEHFDAERAEDARRIEIYKLQRAGALSALADTQALLSKVTAEAASARAEQQRLAVMVADRDAEIERLRNETTEKLKAVDALPADTVWNAPVRSPKRPPAS